VVATVMYQAKRRSSPAEKREPRVLIHLRNFLDRLRAMTDAERQAAAASQWIPSLDCLATAPQPRPSPA
jgi:hypothetical protein